MRPRSSTSILKNNSHSRQEHINLSKMEGNHYILHTEVKKNQGCEAYTSESSIRKKNNLLKNMNDFSEAS